MPGELVAESHFELTSTDVPIPGDGEILVRTICLSAGPAQRGYITVAGKGRSGFLPGVALGEVMRGRGVGVVEQSRHPDFAVGELFVGMLGWQDYSIQRPRADDFVFSGKKITDPALPLTTELGIVGNAGVTAWFGLLGVARLRAGESVLISAAAGGVGSVAGQIARLRGATRVVGLAGTDEKCQWLTGTLGYDVAINYRNDDVGARLSAAFPRGADIFFDNVGGDILDTGLLHLATGARVVICGWISTDYAAQKLSGPANYRQLLYKRASMQGFVVFDYWSRYHEAERELKAWYRDGRLVNCEQVLDGLAQMPLALQSLFTGKNRGIVNCRVAPDPVGR